MNRDDRNVFVWLERIRARPENYLRNSSLLELRSLIWGYYAALDIHGIVESVPHLTRHFNSWLYYHKGWPQAQGWATVIERRHSKPDRALASFFKLVDNFRMLKLTPVCTVKIGALHKPTGERVRYGFDGLMKKPLRVDVVRYHPDPLYFLRFHYRGRVEDWDLLMTGRGEYNTDLLYAKRWVRDEPQVDIREWKPL